MAMPLARGLRLRCGAAHAARSLSARQLRRPLCASHAPAQAETVNYIAHVKTEQNQESVVGLLSMAGKR
jgi:hypothetical protein